MSPSRVAWIAWAAVGVSLVWSLSLPGLPGNAWWLRRFHTPEITREYTFAQTIAMNRNGLDAIEFRPAPAGSRLSGDIRLVLVDITESADDGLVVRTSTIAVAELADALSFRFQFAPIANSRFRMFRFELAATDASSGIALVATRGDRYSEGALLVNGRSRWADLVFQTSATTSSIWATLWTVRTESGVSGRLVLALLAASWLVLGVVVRVLSRVPDDAPPASLPASLKEPT